MVERPIGRVPTEGLGLNTRTLNNLHYEGIKTIGALTKRSPAEMLAWRGFGRTSLREVRRALARIGQTLRDNTAPVR